MIEEWVGNSCKLIVGKDFLSKILRAQALKSTINKQSLMKLNSFCTATITWIKQWPTKLGNIFTNHASNTGLISQLYKELKKVDIMKTSKDFSREKAQMANKQFYRNVQHPQSSKKCKSKQLWHFILYPSGTNKPDRESMILEVLVPGGGHY